VQGFSQASKNGHLGGCFILSNLEDTEPEVPLVQRFPGLTRGHSGQVLLVGSLCESVRGIPGLRFEAVSNEWMTPEAIRVYSEVLELSAPIQMEGVEGPTECWVPAVEAMPQIAEREETWVPPLVAEAPATERAATVELPMAVARDAAAPPPPGNGTGQDIAGFSRTKVAAERKFPLRWIAVGGAAVVVVAAVAMIVPRSKKQEPSAKQAIPVATDPVPTVKPVAPPPLPVAPPVPVAVEKPVKPKVAEPPQVPAAKRKDAASEPDTGRPGDLKFTADEISRMLSMADKDAGDGDYDRAIREYDTALKYDPSNARAKEGRARAIRNKGSE
jgi:hypothetical protein